ncbi:MAG TPA: homocitrate synthase [Dehalococcoidia bacterium]|nr:homocitrate synthase [Dehalococcoidia bacterium]
MPKLYFLDVTNRDAVQASRIIMAKLQKTMLNFYLAEMGIHQSEFAFPTVRHERNYIQGNLELKEQGIFGDLVLEGWCRAIVRDVKDSLASGVRDLNISISTSDQMILHKFRGKLDREQVIREMTEAANYAKSNGVKTLGVNAEDASRTDMGYLTEFAQAAREAGADRIRYCDTLGYDTPMSIYERIKALAEKVKIPIELHCHNDLGMAVANSIAGAKGALDAGVDSYINTSVNGVGERAGQTDLISCILALKFGRDMQDCEIADPLDLTVADKLAKYVSYAFGIPIPINQPGVGFNIFAHEAGIHADGALKDRRNYELFEYEILGRGEDARIPTGRIITTGEFGGIAGFRHVCEDIGITLPDDESAKPILELVQFASAHTQLPLTNDELCFIASHPEESRKILTLNP